MDSPRRQSIDDRDSQLNKLQNGFTRLRFTSDSVGPEKRFEENVDQIKYHYGQILKMIGENPEREGLLDTPKRAAKALMFFTKGYEDSIQNAVKNAVFHEETDEIVIVKDIECFRLWDAIKNVVKNVFFNVETMELVIIQNMKKISGDLK